MDFEEKLAVLCLILTIGLLCFVLYHDKQLATQCHDKSGYLVYDSNSDAICIKAESIIPPK